ncbi:MAG: hypothetical protein RSD01_08110 [Ruthenibacterium sp.]
MPYLDAIEYREIIGGSDLTDFCFLNEYATDVIDRETVFGLIGRDINSFPLIVQRSIKRAAAYEVQYLDACGGIFAVNDVQSQSVSLGKFSYSGAGKTQEVSPLCKEALALVCAYLRGD